MIYLVVFSASGVVVVLAAITLAHSADAVTEATKLSGLWIGSVLLAGATSLPELATDVSAVRLGAVGDLFGSSMADILSLALIDLLPPTNQVLRQVAFDHALAASLAISLNALAAVLVLPSLGLAAIVYRARRSFAMLERDSLLVLIAYGLGMWLLYRHSGKP